MNGENDYTVIFLQSEEDNESDQDMHVVTYQMFGMHHYE